MQIMFWVPQNKHNNEYNKTMRMRMSRYQGLSLPRKLLPYLEENPSDWVKSITSSDFITIQHYTSPAVNTRSIEQLNVWLAAKKSLCFYMVLIFFQQNLKAAEVIMNRKREREREVEPEKDSLDLSRCVTACCVFTTCHNFPILCQLIRKSKHAEVRLISLQSYR